MIDIAINTLLFDLDNTLIDQLSSLEQWLVPYDDIVDTPKALMDFKQTQDMRVITRTIATLNKVDHKMLIDDYQNYLMKSIAPDASIHQLLKALSEQFVMAIVSNGDHVKQMEKIKRAGLKPFFKTITTSGQLGSRKPQSRIFLQTLKNIHKTPEQSLFIGDDLINDIQGAHQVRMKTCWLSKNKLPNNPPVHPTYHIQQLAELESLLL